jgi:hypothetical protein
LGCAFAGAALWAVVPASAVVVGLRARAVTATTAHHRAERRMGLLEGYVPVNTGDARTLVPTRVS